MRMIKRKTLFILQLAAIIQLVLGQVYVNAYSNFNESPYKGKDSIEEEWSKRQGEINEGKNMLK